MSIVYACNENVAHSAAPPIPLAGAWARRFPASPDNPLINLSQGVPGAPPPPELLSKLGEAAADPKTTGYGALQGDDGIRSALARDIAQTYGTKGDALPVDVEDVVITAGCNLAFYSAMLALAAPGDEIILPTPWYFNHQMSLNQLGLSLVPLRCAPPSFLPSPAECAQLVTSRTKAIVLVSPNNPTGAIYPPELLRQFAELAQERKVALIVDETYREFVTGRPHDLFAETDWRSYLIHLFSFSKSYAIPGHRLGALVASPAFQKHVYKLLDCLQICPARPAQRTVEWAIDATRPWREGVREELARRQDVFREMLDEVEGWEVETGGAYFAYVKHPYPGASSESVASRLAEHVGIVALPGTFFSPPFDNVDDDAFIRFSIANVSEDVLRGVPERLRRLNELWPSL
ncbi:uncharacterized protein JCM10292_006121 [Rhodotorula paludigena]|uniref:uncharacterized protein n=1 Tax=Rhodotorula paludigena TaxID=86838 RepID=UPI00317ED818